MKKLYKKGTVHPVSDNLLAFLPATILTLTVGLSQEDKQVLAYLISCSSGTLTAAYGSVDHLPCFSCSCFSCYMSYWVRWDLSPNRQLIHEIIEAYEEDSSQVQRIKKLENNKREKRKNKSSKNRGFEKTEEVNRNRGAEKTGELNKNRVSEEQSLNRGEPEEDSDTAEHGGGDGCAAAAGEEDSGEKGAVRRFVSFVGEKIWSSIWT